MKNFKEIDKRKVEEVEESILKGKKKEDILNETIENRKNGKTWVFYDGPIMQMLNQEFTMYLLKLSKIHFVNIIQ